MKKIQLQYVVNETTSRSGVFQQELNFFLVVENLAYEKKIDIVLSLIHISEPTRPY